MTGKNSGRNQILGQFIPRPIGMMESPSFRVLSLSAHRVLARVELEHGSHGGMENGRLPVTFQDFIDYGIDHHAVRPTIAECVALGFLQITERGRAGNGEFRSPNKFRLTYINMRGIKASHEWKTIETDEQAREIAKTARMTKRSAQRQEKRRTLNLKQEVQPARYSAPDGRASRAAEPVATQDIDSTGEIPIKTDAHSTGEIPIDSAEIDGKNPRETWRKTPVVFVSRGAA